eukprot:6367858-Pyramimonas_sp.AAC.1
MEVDGKEDESKPQELRYVSMEPANAEPVPTNVQASSNNLANKLKHKVDESDDVSAPKSVMTDGVKNKVVARSPAYQQFGRWLNDKATEQELADWEK